MVKVRFNLVHDSDGCPPVDNEGLWALSLGGSQYRLNNTPWFVRGVACEDVVEAVPDIIGTLWVSRRVAWSGRHVVRLTPAQQHRRRPSRRPPAALVKARKDLKKWNVGVESMGPPQWMVALDIPADADFKVVKQYIRDGHQAGRWDYEEGCVGEIWERT